MVRIPVFMLVASLVFGACQDYRNLVPYEGTTCSGHGTYSENNGEAVCTCDEGYAGDLCTECGAGYHDEGGECVVNVVCEADSCSGYGTCDDSTGVVTCACDEGYEGRQCETCSSGYQDNDADGACLPGCATSGLDCGTHGSCDDSGGEAVCVCDLGYTGALCDTCNAGYQDNDGDGTCLPDCATSGLDCGLHGACDDSSGAAVCTCDEGYVGDYCDTCAPEYEDFGSGCVLFWVSIPGGTFMMGSDSGESDELPLHQVTVPAFEMTMTEVTVAQYQACVDAGACTEPSQCGSFYNWGVAGREDHPVNCVNWQQAVDFCGFAGGRLPSEAEWEYTARGGGQDITYPWGEDIPSCIYAVINDGGAGCGMDRTWAVCSKPAGNTAQGLCDMAGNVFEWVQDWFHGSYDCDANPGAINCGSGGIAPSDGSAWETPGGSIRVIRGGSLTISADGSNLRAATRSVCVPSYRHGRIGFRCAR